MPLPIEHREKAAILIAAWAMGLTLKHPKASGVNLRPKNKCAVAGVPETFMKRYIRKHALNIEIKT